MLTLPPVVRCTAPLRPLLRSLLRSMLHSILRPIPYAALGVVLATAPVCAQTPAEPVTLGDFSLHVSGDTDDDNRTAQLCYKGKALFTEPQHIRWIEESRYEHDECSSLWLYFFTGGASCCFGSYLLTQCPEQNSATVVFNNSFEMEKAPEDLAAQGAQFTVFDTRFVSYSPSEPAGASALSFSRAESPAMQRLLLFDGTRWHFDAPGQFADFHKSQEAALQTADASDDVSSAGLAMRKAYHAFLADGNRKRARTVFMQAFPGSYRSVADAVFEDVIEAAGTTTPLMLSHTPVDDPATWLTRHTVQPGETLYSVSRQYKVTPASILSANPNLASPDTIQAGQTLLVPVLNRIR